MWGWSRRVNFTVIFARHAAISSRCDHRRRWRNSASNPARVPPELIAKPLTAYNSLGADARGAIGDAWSGGVARQSCGRNPRSTAAMHVVEAGAP